MRSSLPKLKVLRYQEFSRWPEPCEFAPSSMVSPAARYCNVFKQANALGWKIFPPFNATITWRGGREFDVEVEDELGTKLWSEVMKEIHGWPSSWWCSKIDGVFQVDPGLIFITPPSIKTFLTGPVNRPNSYYWTQSGVLDSDWFWVPSTINLQIWKANAPFTLRRNEAIAQLILMDHQLVTAQSSNDRLLEAVDQIDEAAALEQWIKYLIDTYGSPTEWDAGMERRRQGGYLQLKKKEESRMYDSSQTGDEQ